MDKYTQANNLTTEEITRLKRLAVNIRKQVINMIYSGKHGHTGGSLSCADILTALYFHVLNIKPENPCWEDRDRFIMSKGHSVEALYAILAEAGFFSKKLLETYGQFKSPLAGHPVKEVPGVELNSGALGHGLSVGVGMAIAGKRMNKNFKVFVLMGDGEQNEGSVAEAAIAGSFYQLDNLVAIIDRNRLQISGNTEDVMALEPLKNRWEAFGWNVEEFDGHDLAEIIHALKDNPHRKNVPRLFIANTIKGKGISFIENDYKWHHRVPDDEQYQRALRELQRQLKNIN